MNVQHCYNICNLRIDSQIDKRESEKEKERQKEKVRNVDNSKADRQGLYNKLL